MPKYRRISIVLRKAADLIEKSPGLSKGRFARDKFNNPVDYKDSPAAVSFCALGAVARVQRSDNAMSNPSAIFLFDHLPEVTNGLNVFQYNDLPETTKENVASLLRQASESAKKAGL